MILQPQFFRICRTDTAGVAIRAIVRVPQVVVRNIARRRNNEQVPIRIARVGIHARRCKPISHAHKIINLHLSNANRWLPDQRPGQPLHLHYIYISYVEIPVVLSVDFKVGVILDFRETAGRTPQVRPSET